ncbi:DUF6114 domain-containing protein [Actinoplanes sp. NPDC049596]|uniref:DUF6114 domain-containing protein n=1 Tax=unclassified Actinoplanes TaxID=2626549 RepID=UPI00342FBC2F
MATDDFWSRFRRWRRSRPFWGGLFLLLSGIEMFLSANMSLGSMEVHLGPQGFLSYLLPLMMLLSGALSWASPGQRLFYGIVGLLTALYSFIGLNLGGFLLGMMIGIVGGALVIAWGPPRVKPAAPAAGEEPPAPPTSDELYFDDDMEVAGHDDRPTRPILRSADNSDNSDTAVIPGLPPEEPRNGVHPRTLGVILLVLAVTTGVLVAGTGRPARAVECPEGLPSRAATTSAAASSAPPSSVPVTAARGARTVPPGTTAATNQPTAGGTSAPASSASPSASPTASASSSAPAGNPVADGVEDFFDGLGNLLGIGDDESPSTSPSPSETTPAPTSAPTSAPATSAPATSAPSTSAPATSAPTTPPTTAPTTPPATSKPTPSPSVEEIPCLGPRVMGKVASADDIPKVSEKPGLMEVKSLTMYESTYDGVVDMPTAKGSFKALKFSMDKAVNKPFTLTIDEAGRARTVIKSNELVTDGTVRFYTPNFQGKLFGVIPVTFTPEQPPPLTLPVLWFTDVKIQLAYVRCDTLTGAPLNINETV